jgi:hypothetical protein
MKQYSYLLAWVLVGLSLTGCMSPQGRPDYTASGALAGGATGAIIGSTGHHPGPAGLVGAAVGAVVGGIIGHGMDQAQEAHLRAQAPQTIQRIEQSQPLTVADIISLVKAGVSDDLVISQIRYSRTVYHLNSGDIIELKNTGVSERIIDFMINTPAEMRSTEVVGVAGNTPPPIVEQIVVAPGPEYVWVGGGWFWYGDRWIWRHGYWNRPHYYRHDGYGRRW